MYQQHCIRETLTSEAGAARVAALMAAESFPSRTAAGRRVCEAFGFRDARGGLQQAGCVKALRVLEAAGRIRLPEPLNRGGGRRLGIWGKRFRRLKEYRIGWRWWRD